ncbi:MAG: hypothetical protein LBU12_04545 [Deltaproteobacteria bacterium]|jgi:hypothetical protein|nr:hypothetical protein [Deltaproteobacteria bacterium]
MPNDAKNKVELEAALQAALAELEGQPPSADEDPLARRWLWVLTVPVTKHRDSMMLIEDEGRDAAPYFGDRQAAEAFLERLGPESGGAAQAMHFFDLVKFAAGRGLTLIELDGAGRVLDRRRPEPVEAAEAAAAGQTVAGGGEGAS